MRLRAHLAVDRPVSKYPVRACSRVTRHRKHTWFFANARSYVYQCPGKGVLPR